ncbi:hypothetical protein HDU97_004526 [Phlyctochytrium planicorne]|nr:hypothetical protein HDU97_004526 [Phlyctochytrium planicorne]
MSTSPAYAAAAAAPPPTSSTSPSYPASRSSPNMEETSVVPFSPGYQGSSFPRSISLPRKSFISQRTTASGASMGAMRSFGEVLPVTVKAKGVSVWAGKNSSSSKSQAILNDVTLTVPSGQLLAILGGSGSGKTTLLNALAGRTQNAKITGKITFNGQAPDPYISGGYVAYVQQQDYLLPCLTVRETLRYAARLRLPREMTKSQKYALVEAAIAELGLKDCADTQIGNEHRKGISGGERRRVTVAVQLLMNPSVIFMDEPTTGLDAWTSHNLVRTLLNLCRKGRTIIMSIHQPRSTTFSLFHSIALLAKGDVVYSGPASDVESYFASIGHPIGKSVNVAEFLIDQTSVDTRDKNTEVTCKTRLAKLVEEWRSYSTKTHSSQSSDENVPFIKPITPNTDSKRSTLNSSLSRRWTVSGDRASRRISGSPNPMPVRQNHLSGEFAISHSMGRSESQFFMQALTLSNSPTINPLSAVERHRSHTVIGHSSVSSCASSSETAVGNLSRTCSTENIPGAAATLHTNSSGDETNVGTDEEDIEMYEPVPIIKRISFIEEVGVLCHRSTTNLLRDRMLVWGTMVEAIVVGLITGAMFWQLAQTRAGIIGRQALLGSLSGAFNFLLMTFGSYKLCADFRVFDRERKDKMYRVESFLISSIITNSILFSVHGFLIGVVVYPMAGLRGDFLLFHFPIFIAGMILLHICTLVWSHLFVAISRDFSTAAVLVNLVCAFLVTSTGYLIPQTVIPIYLKWVNTISFFTAGYRLLLSNEFSGNSFTCPELPMSNSPQCQGDRILKSAGVEAYDYVYPFVNFLGNLVIVTGLVCLFLYTFVPGQQIHQDTFIDKMMAYFSGLSKNRKGIFRAKSVRGSIVGSPSLPLDKGLKESGKADTLQIAVGVSPSDWDSVKVDIVVENLSITTGQDKASGLCLALARNKGKSNGCILDDVSAEFPAGRLNVIMGSSGAGKTTLLNSLMARPLQFGRSTYCGGTPAITGRILYGGLDLQPAEVSGLCSYVCQDDLHHLPALTARETLRYAAMLRLPSTMSVKEKLARAEEVLLELGLKDCGDIRVGDELIKGLSGGEKRRLSIGVQIITNPKVLILDEPTSGLDAFSSHMVMLSLKKIAESGKTVICTIHQPRSDLIELFDTLTLLARGGKLVYSGPMHSAVAYFEELGYSLPRHTNPADFFLDLSSVDQRCAQFEADSQRRVDHLVESWKSRNADAPRSSLPSNHSSSKSKSSIGKALSAAMRRKISVKSNARRSVQFTDIVLTEIVHEVDETAEVDDAEVKVGKSTRPESNVSAAMIQYQALIQSEKLGQSPNQRPTSNIIDSPDLSESTFLASANSSESSPFKRRPLRIDPELASSHRRRGSVHMSATEEFKYDPFSIQDDVIEEVSEETNSDETTTMSDISDDAATFATAPSGVLRAKSFHTGREGDVEEVYLAKIVETESLRDDDDEDDEDEDDEEGDDEDAENQVEKLQDEKEKERDLISFYVKRRMSRNASNFLVAVPVLLSRMFKNAFRQITVVADRLGTALGMAVIVVLYTYKLDLTEAKVQARLGILHQITGLLYIAMMSNVATFNKDLALYRFDHGDHAYSLESFMAAGFLTELPFQIFTSVTFTLVYFFFVGLQASVVNFFVFSFVSYAYMSTGESIGISFCALVQTSPFTVQVMSAIITVISLLSGFLAIGPPAFIDRLNYMSVVKYASQALGIAEFRGTQVICPYPEADNFPANPPSTAPVTTTKISFIPEVTSLAPAIPNSPPQPTSTRPIPFSATVGPEPTSTRVVSVSPGFFDILSSLKPATGGAIAAATPAPLVMVDTSALNSLGLQEQVEAGASPTTQNPTLDQAARSNMTAFDAAHCRYRDGDDVLALLGFEGTLSSKIAGVAVLMVAYRFVAYLVLKVKFR